MGPSGRGNERLKAARDRTAEIRKAAARVFRKKGYEGASVKDIADELGLQKGSLYHHIESKEQLLFDILMAHNQYLIENATAIYAEDLSPSGKLRKLLHFHISNITTEQDIVYESRQDLRALSEEHSAQCFPGRDQYERVWRQVIKDGITAGEFKPVDVKLTCLAILGMCNWMMYWYSPNGELPAEAIIAYFTELVIEGMLRPTIRT